VDQRTQAAANERVISTPLYQAITACLARQEQCLILINRRGFAAYLQCRTCGLVPSCVHCSVSLTYHRREHTLRCHYCGFAQPMLTLCPTCNTPSLQLYGLGTQQVEAAVQTLFPNARLGRMDRDTTRGKLSHHHILQALSQGDIDILVGTQMIAKGHDYPNITLVGVVAADASLAIPDFRAPERLFQLLTQVAGRAGRGEAPGQVFIQTYRPEHYSIDFAREHNFSGFSQDELPRRQAMLYPPYARLARLIVESPEANRAQAASQWLGTVLQRQLADHADVMLLGPAEAPLTKINDRYRWHILVRTVSSRTLHAFLSASLADMRQQRRHLQGARLSIDIDPLTFL
jgi:primosomal protein N' (replication factor Y)